MKVIYDISVLGLGHIFPKARTGVFRVVENVATELVKNSACDIVFCGDIDRNTIENIQDYLNENKQFSGVPFSKPPFFNLRLKTSLQKDALIKMIVNGQPLSTVTRVKTKWKIKELIAIERLTTLYNDDLLHPRDVARADIYHSPFYAIPSHVKNSKYKAVFLTCYDLIPILFPHYCELGVIELIKKTLDSISIDTWVLCISEATRNDLLNYMGNKLDPQRVLVTELAASDVFYRCTDKVANALVRKRNNIPDVPYILSVCTFEPRKNIDQVIKAFAKIIVQEHIQDLVLVLVGAKGWKYEKIFDEIENSPILKGRVVITGYVADDDLAAIYSDALAFVYPSYYEGFGLPPLEAMKCGTPVITSNTSSLPEVVGDAGIMVEPTDLDAICQAILSVYKSPDLRNALEHKSLDRSRLFSWERCGNQTVDAYKASLSM